MNNHQKKRRANKAVCLGEVMSEFMEARIAPQFNRFSSVAKLWDELLPAGLAEHCEIVEISAGRLKVQVDSPSYMYELQLCRSELLRELQRHSAIRIKDIKFQISNLKFEI